MPHVGCAVVKAHDKPAWRARLLAARAALPAAAHSAEAAALAEHVRGLSATVCGYVPVGSEPGSVHLLDVLVAAGCRVLLPVVATRGAVLDWAQYHGEHELVPGAYGLREPAGRRLGPGALADAATVLVPALAVDLHGVRLGRGGGYYDRSLGLAAPAAALVAVVRDAELLPQLPEQPHDVRMSAALTPVAGFTQLHCRPVS